MYTRKKSHLNVLIVEKSLRKAASWGNIFAHIRKKKHTNVLFAKRSFRNMRYSSDISEYIWMKSHMNALIVKGSLLTKKAISNIWKLIKWRTKRWTIRCLMGGGLGQKKSCTADVPKEGKHDGKRNSAQPYYGEKISYKKKSHPPQKSLN